MRVAITGASGNLGTALLRRLAGERTVSVVAISRRVPRGEPYGQWVACDVGQPGGVAALAEAFAQADAVVHLAWAIQPRPDDRTALRTNLYGTQQVLRAAVVAGVPHVVCASSVAAYQGAPRSVLVDEAWPRGGIPGSAYSRQKAGLERLLDQFERDHPEVALTRVRPCSVAKRDTAGEIGRYLFGPLVPRQLLGRVPVPLLLDPRLRFQLVHADDVAEALWRILSRTATGAFNLAAPGFIGPRELADTLRTRYLACPYQLLLVPTWLTWRLGLQPVHPGWLRLLHRAALVSTIRARRELGWQPRHDAADTLAELFAGLREEAGTSSPVLHGGGRQPRLGRPRTHSQATR